MLIKRLLPWLVLLVMSVVVAACALGLVWVLAVDAHTPEEKLQVSLSLGLPSALALIVLLWLGAGMDQVLAYIKRTSTRIGVSLLTYLVVPPALCVGLPLAVGAAIYFGLNPPQGWRELPAPPEAAVEVAAADEVRVIVRTASGAYYRRPVGATDAAWEAVERPVQRMTGRGLETDAPPALDPPAGVVSMLGLTYTDLGEEGQAYFAVLDDGSVWYWLNDANRYEAGFAAGLFLTIAFIPAVLGLVVIYVGIGVSALTRRLAGV